MADEYAKAGLRWTGHVLIDAGAAMLTVYAGCKKPEDVTMGDLDRFAGKAEELYLSPLMQSYLTVLFTSNGPITQPSYSHERRAAEARRLLRYHRVPAPPGAEECAFCGRPSVQRVHRDMMPMLSGQGVSNFFPFGRSGLPACGLCILCLLALGLGAPSCSGRALVIEAEDRELLLRVTEAWYRHMLQAIQLSMQVQKKVPVFSHPLTRTVEALVHLQEEAAADEDVPTRAGLTVYHLTNSGQGPDIDIRRLPSCVVRFVWRAVKAKYSQAWKDIVNRHWVVARGQEEDKLRRNLVYESLFTLPEQAGRFVRRFILPEVVEQTRSGSVQPADLGHGTAGYVPGRWNLVELLAEEVLGVERERIRAIRELGDVLAEEVSAGNDVRLFRQVVMASDYRAVRSLLIRASVDRVRRGAEPVTGFERFLTVFEEGEEVRRVDWSLAWDLTIIRFIEALWERGWFSNKAVVEEALEQVGSSEG